MKTIGENIRYYRNLRGWSQEEMADKLNVSLPTYSRIERNIIDISYKRLLQIAKTCDISITELISSHDQSKKPNEINPYETKKHRSNQVNEPKPIYETSTKTTEQKYLKLLEDYAAVLKENNLLLRELKKLKKK